MNITMAPTASQPHSITDGPPVFRPKPYKVMQPDKTLMTLKEIAKFPNGPMRRVSMGS
ncbi:hypothetical protein GCM10020295_37410 [Streptomyces cinereospinus]